MAFDTVIDKAQLEAAMKATADAIREKTGDTANCTWDPAQGFAALIAAIESGGGGVVVEFGTYIPAETKKQSVTLEFASNLLVNRLILWNDTGNNSDSTSLFGVLIEDTDESSSNGSNYRLLREYAYYSTGRYGTHHRPEYRARHELMSNLTGKIKINSSQPIEWIAGTTYKWIAIMGM